MRNYLISLALPRELQEDHWINSLVKSGTQNLSMKFQSFLALGSHWKVGDLVQSYVRNLLNGVEDSTFPRERARAGPAQNVPTAQARLNDALALSKYC